MLGVVAYIVDVIRIIRISKSSPLDKSSDLLGAFNALVQFLFLLVFMALVFICTTSTIMGSIS